MAVFRTACIVSADPRVQLQTHRVGPPTSAQGWLSSPRRGSTCGSRRTSTDRSHPTEDVIRAVLAWNARGLGPEGKPCTCSRKRAARSVAAASTAALIGGGVMAAAAAPATAGTPAAHQAATAKHRVVANHCKKSKKDVPRCGVLWGAYLPPVAGKGQWQSAYPSLESQIGRRFDIVKRYIGWSAGTTFPNPVDKTLADHNRRVLDYSWNAQNYSTRAKISYRSIAAGDWDSSVILPEARALKRSTTRSSSTSTTSSTTRRRRARAHRPVRRGLPAHPSCDA